VAYSIIRGMPATIAIEREFTSNVKIYDFNHNLLSPGKDGVLDVDHWMSPDTRESVVIEIHYCRGNVTSVLSQNEFTVVTPTHRNGQKVRNLTADQIGYLCCGGSDKRMEICDDHGQLVFSINHRDADAVTPVDY